MITLRPLEKVEATLTENHFVSTVTYRLGTVNSKSFVGKVLLRIIRINLCPVIGISTKTSN